MVGEVERIWVKRAKRGQMDDVCKAEVDEQGIVGNADRGGRRQIALLSTERWDAICAQLDAEIDPVVRRSNVLVSGLDLANTRGRRLRVGEVELEVTTETSPCRLMDFVHVGLQEALRSDWGGGASTRVVSSGTIRVGDPIGWID